MTMYDKVRYRLVWNHARRLNTRGEGLVQIECQQGRRRIYFSTHTYLPPENWCKGFVVGTTDDGSRNYALRRMMWEVEQVELEFLKKGIRLTLPALKDAVRKRVNPAARLRDFIVAMLQDSERKDATRQNYRTLMNDIDRFRPNTYLTDVDYQWVMAYDRYLKDGGMAHNTRISRLSLLRSVMNEASRRDLTYQDAFRRVKLEKMIAKKGYVTMQQLRALERMRLDGRQDVVRDLFLIGCYTGLRFSDIRTLRQEHINDDWIKKKTIKTGVTVELPCARLFGGRFFLLVAKYGGDIGRLTKKAPTNSETNKLLKPLLAKVKADARVTFHSSRHTFATLLGLQGVGIETIQRLLGHTSVQMTQIYNEAQADRRADIERGLKRLFKE